MTVIEYAKKINLFKYLANDHIAILNEWQKAYNDGESYIRVEGLRNGKHLLYTITQRYLGYKEGVVDGRAEAIAEFRINLKEDVCARAKSICFMSKDEKEAFDYATKTFLDALDYFAEKVKEQR